MQKISNILILSLMLVFLFSLSSVCAEDNSNKNITQINDNIDTNTDTHLDSINEDIEKDESKILCSTITNSSKNNDKLTKNKENIKKQQKSEDTLSTDNEENDYTYHINSSNIGHYFDQNGIINRGFEESILIFDGEFINQGILTINSPNVNIIGNNTLFNNTVFCLESNNILLNGLNFVLDQEFYDNDYAGILILGDNNTVYNCTMNYTVPDNCNGYCVYVEGTNDYNINGFQLINNTFNFKGNNNNEVYDYGVFVDYVDNALVYGNIINAELPLRAVDWSKEIFAGVRMDYVGAFVAETSQNLILTNNHITTKVIGIKNILPTLDTVIIYDCNNSVIESNYIYSEDFISKDGKANYLQGIDLYISSNVTIINNQIHMRTTGGCEKHGTAYPIQVTGPANNITIAYNNLSSVNKGPNLGIYAHNFYGETRLYIISNYINVTGLAGNDSWALVAGIEVQDSDDLIWNNTIYVTNIGDYDDKNNVYGISYSQNTENNHTYNIQHNKVTTNGNKAVSLSGRNSLVVNSIVANNVLKSLISSGDGSVFIGKGENNSVYNNTDGSFNSVMNTDDLPSWLKNHKTLTSPKININTRKTKDSENSTSTNIRPKYTDENSNGSGLTNNKGNGVMPWNKAGSHNGLQKTDNNNNKGTKNNNNIISNGTNHNSDNIKGSTRNIALKIGGKQTPPKATHTPSDTGSSASKNKAYEVKEKAKKIINKDNYLPAIIASAIIILLILAGYKRKNNTEEE